MKKILLMNQLNQPYIYLYQIKHTTKVHYILLMELLNYILFYFVDIVLIIYFILFRIPNYRVKRFEAIVIEICDYKFIIHIRQDQVFCSMKPIEDWDDCIKLLVTTYFFFFFMLVKIIVITLSYFSNELIRTNLKQWARKCWLRKLCAAK